MAQGWGVNQAVFYPQGKSSQSASSDISTMSRIDKMNQPDVYDKQEIKDENKDMLYKDKLFFLQNLNNISQQEKSIKSGMMNYFMTNHGTPPAEKQQEWNKQLAEVENARTQIKSMESMLKLRYEEYKRLSSKTENRIAVTRNNQGAYEAYLGPKENGSIGWLTQPELLDQNINQLGMDQYGRPTGIDFPSDTGYTGSYNTYFNMMVQNSSQNYSNVAPNEDGTITVNGVTMNKEAMNGIKTLLEANNVTQLKEAADVVYNTMPENARTDMGSKFHENLLRAGYSKDEKKNPYMVMPLDRFDGKYGFKIEGTDYDVMNKYINGINLTTQEKHDLANIQEQYARQLIYSMVPGRVLSKENLEGVTTGGASDGSDGKNVQGPMTQIARHLLTGVGKEPDKEINRFMVIKNNVPTAWQSPDIVKYSIGNPQYVSGWNSSAEESFSHNNPIKPNSLTTKPYWINTESTAYPVTLLEKYGVAITGLAGSGEVRQFPEPMQTRYVDENGNNMFQLNYANHIKDTKTTTTVAYRMAIPKDNFSDFIKDMKEMTPSIIKTDDLESLFTLGYKYGVGEKGQKTEPYYYFTGYEDVDIMTLQEFDNIQNFEKGKFDLKNLENSLLKKKQDAYNRENEIINQRAEIKK